MMRGEAAGGSMGSDNPVAGAETPPRTDAAPALEVSRLSFAYGKRRVLHEVGLRVMPGEFAVLLGPNGAGKSTLFALITRLFDAPPPGSVRIFGAAMREAPG